MITTKCTCGEELKYKEMDPQLGQVGDVYQAYCKCRKIWQLADITEEYEEMVINSVTEPQHEEYENEEGIWCYADGTYME